MLPLVAKLSASSANLISQKPVENAMIAFYVVTDEYGYLCNFSAHGFVLDGNYWPTVEHYFQAQKFVGSEHADRIRAAPTPKDAKALGRTRRIPLRADWEEVKVSVMRKAVLAKFQSHPTLAGALIATGNEEIVETAPGDYSWGCGKLGTGLNWLGRILMDVRDILRIPGDEPNV